ncbi:hypothetical protein pb186bvf_003064 [Paramecium bursaria]
MHIRLYLILKQIIIGSCINFCEQTIKYTCINVDFTCADYDQDQCESADWCQYQDGECINNSTITVIPVNDTKTEMKCRDIYDEDECILIILVKCLMHLDISESHNHVKKRSVFYRRLVNHTPHKMNAHRYRHVLIQMKGVHVVAAQVPCFRRQHFY